MSLWGAPYLENVKHLRENGFRIFEIKEVRREDSSPSASYHVTWDSNADFTFSPHFAHYMQKAHATGSEQGSFNEVLVGV